MKRQPVVPSRAKAAFFRPRAAKERADLLAARWPDHPPLLLAGSQVEVVVGDLPTVDVEPSYDPHGDLLWLLVLRESTHLFKYARRT